MSEGVAEREGRWVDLVDPDAKTLDAAVPYRLHPSARDRMLHPTGHGDERRPRLELHEDYLFGILVVPTLGAGTLAFDEIDVIVDHERFITVRKSSDGDTPFDIEHLRRASMHDRPGTCLYVLLDEIAEQFLTLVDCFDDDIDELEDHVETMEGTAVRERVSELRHDILHVRRVLAPTRDLARSVLDDRVDLPGDPPLFPHEIEIHFADAYDKLLRAADGLELSRDLLAGVRDYHQAQVAHVQNEVMKRLTVVASLLLVPTFIVGLYGQNFDRMPELGWAHGYAWSWFLIVATTIGQLVYFRRKRWI
jgi:magnesium transporter